MAREMLALLALSIGFSTPAHAEVESGFHESDSIRKIAFGSCSDPRKWKSLMFAAVQKHEPDAFVFLGDNI